jgi:hypothetical protein
MYPKETDLTFSPRPLDEMEVWEFFTLDGLIRLLERFVSLSNERGTLTQPLQKANRTLTGLGNNREAIEARREDESRSEPDDERKMASAKWVYPT